MYNASTDSHQIHASFVNFRRQLNISSPYPVWENSPLNHHVPPASKKREHRGSHYHFHQKMPWRPLSLSHRSTHSWNHLFGSVGKKEASDKLGVTLKKIYLFKKTYQQHNLRFFERRWMRLWRNSPVHRLALINTPFDPLFFPQPPWKKLLMMARSARRDTKNTSINSAQHTQNPPWKQSLWG